MIFCTLCSRTFRDLFSVERWDLSTIASCATRTWLTTLAMAMCANGIKIRLRTGNFFFCHHNLNRPAKRICINCRATDSHSSKTNANKYSKKYTKIVCSPAHFDFASKKGLCNWWQNFRNKYWAHKSFCWISFIMHYGQSIDNSLITLLKRSWIHLVNMFIAYMFSSSNNIFHKRDKMVQSRVSFWTLVLFSICPPLPSLVVSTRQGWLLLVVP